MFKEENIISHQVEVHILVHMKIYQPRKSINKTRKLHDFENKQVFIPLNLTVKWATLGVGKW